MLITTSHYSFAIDDKALDALCKNPFKYPKPGKMQSITVLPEGRKEPGVPTTFAFNYLYSRSIETVQALLVQKVIEKAQKEGPDAEFGGPLAFKTKVAIRPWEFEVSVEFAAGTVTNEQARASLWAGDAWRRNVKLHIMSAEIKSGNGGGFKNVGPHA